MKRDRKHELKILVLGVGGMLGNTLFRYLIESTNFKVVGSLRNNRILNRFTDHENSLVATGIDLFNFSSVDKLITQECPEVVVNCIGTIKQIEESLDPSIVLPTNSIFPKRLSTLAHTHNFRLIQVSTDCVFSGSRHGGDYTESDIPDPTDLYGMSKLLGEIDNSDRVVTIRTSIIGHEIYTNRSLLDWFLSSVGSVRGYKSAVFSGLTTVELSSVIANYIIPHRELNGTYHVSSEPIDKFSLLSMAKQIYGKEIVIEPDYTVEIDRSLNSEKFKSVTGYVCPTWEEMITSLRNTVT